MCGIAGSINHRLDIPMLTRDMWHRGPDEQATFAENGLQLHHHRLAIVDIACGKQPMNYQHLTLIFNGEIYNHMELRRKNDLHCTTNSDTETLLHLYAKLGAECLKQLDGMFALVIFDRQRDELFIARDRAGKKPVYYYHDGNRFVFASELRALRKQLSLQIDENHIDQYLKLGFFFKSATPYQNVKELEAGSYAVVSVQEPKITIKKWWNIHDHYLKDNQDNFSTALGKIDTMLHDAVRTRVESSDLEVGSFLSGGIDSGIVTAIAKQYNASLKTFTVSFEGGYNEAPLAKLVAERYKTDHHEININFNNLLNDVETIIGNYGEPFFDSSAIPSYYVSKAAREHLTVILNGDGGDEVFGGYRRYVPFAKYDFFQPGIAVKGISKTLHALLPPPNNKQSKYNFLYRLSSFAAKDGLDTYLSATIDTFSDFEKYLTVNEASMNRVREDFEFIRKSKLTGLQKIMNLDFDFILAGNLLVKMDIATMAHSLEGRSPLLCKEILEYVPSLPDNYKIRGSKTKFLLRTLAEKYLPHELIHQPKRGFEIPLKNWVDNELKSIIGDHILSPNAYAQKFVEKDFIQKLWTRKIGTGDEKRAKIIWTLFALEVWYKSISNRS